MNGDRFVVFRPDRASLAALPARHVRETMRPLPIEPIANAPPFVRGAAVVRGRAVPVVDAAKLVTGVSEPDVARWIAIDVGERSVVLAVFDVVDVRPLGANDERVAPLLSNAKVVDELRSLDGELLAILNAGRVVDAG